MTDTDTLDNLVQFFSNGEQQNAQQKQFLLFDRLAREGYN